MPREDDMRISNGRLLDNFHRLNDEKKIDFFMPISMNVGYTGIVSLNIIFYIKISLRFFPLKLRSIQESSFKRDNLFFPTCAVYF